MLIWLGKQYLGQREQSYLDIDVDVKKLSDEELEAVARGEIPSGLRIGLSGDGFVEETRKS
jgi:hypothetical protein